MTRRKIGEENVRNLLRLGRSIAVTIPAAITRAMKLKERQKVTVKRQGASIVIRDWKK